MEHIVAPDELDEELELDELDEELELDELVLEALELDDAMPPAPPCPPPLEVDVDELELDDAAPPAPPPLEVEPDVVPELLAPPPPSSVLSSKSALISAAHPALTAAIASVTSVTSVVGRIRTTSRAAGPPRSA